MRTPREHYLGQAGGTHVPRHRVCIQRRCCTGRSPACRDVRPGLVVANPNGQGRSTAMAPEHRRPPARAETHRSMTATTKAKPQRSPSSVLDHLKDTLGVREKRPVSLAHVKRNALLVDPNRWSDVPEVDDCFIKAVENSERAASAKRAADRALYLRMERKWLGLAEGLAFDRRPQTTSPVMWCHGLRLKIWFHAWRDADLFESGWDGKPEHHEFRDYGKPSRARALFRGPFLYRSSRRNLASRMPNSRRIRYLPRCSRCLHLRRRASLPDRQSRPSRRRGTLMKRSQAMVFFPGVGNISSRKDRIGRRG